MSPTTCEKDLRDYFGTFGQVAEATIVPGNQSLSSKGFVTLTNCAAAQKFADRTLIHNIKGCPVQVRRVLQLQNSQEQLKTDVVNGEKNRFPSWLQSEQAVTSSEIRPDVVSGAAVIETYSPSRAHCSSPSVLESFAQYGQQDLDYPSIGPDAECSVGKCFNSADHSLLQLIISIIHEAGGELQATEGLHSLKSRLQRDMPSAINEISAAGGLTRFCEMHSPFLEFKSDGCGSGLVRLRRKFEDSNFLGGQRDGINDVRFESLNISDGQCSSLAMRVEDLGLCGAETNRNFRSPDPKGLNASMAGTKPKTWSMWGQGPPIRSAHSETDPVSGAQTGSVITNLPQAFTGSKCSDIERPSWSVSGFAPMQTDSLANTSLLSTEGIQNRKILVYRELQETDNADPISTKGTDMHNQSTISKNSVLPSMIPRQTRRLETFAQIEDQQSLDSLRVQSERHYGHLSLQGLRSVEQRPTHFLPNDEMIQGPAHQFDAANANMNVTHEIGLYEPKMYPGMNHALTNAHSSVHSAEGAQILAPSHNLCIFSHVGHPVLQSPPVGNATFDYDQEATVHTLQNVPGDYRNLRSNREFLSERMVSHHHNGGDFHAPAVPNQISPLTESPLEFRNRQNFHSSSLDIMSEGAGHGGVQMRNQMLAFYPQTESSHDAQSVGEVLDALLPWRTKDSVLLSSPYLDASASQNTTAFREGIGKVILGKLIEILQQEGGELLASLAPDKLYASVIRGKEEIAAVGGLRKFCLMYPAEIEFVSDTGGRCRIRLRDYGIPETHAPFPSGRSNDNSVSGGHKAPVQPVPTNAGGRRRDGNSTEDRKDFSKIDGSMKSAKRSNASESNLDIENGGSLSSIAAANGLGAACNAEIARPPSVEKLVAILRAEGGDMSATQATSKLYKALPRAKDEIVGVGGLRKYCSLYPADLEFVADLQGRCRIRARRRNTTGARGSGSARGLPASRVQVTNLSPVQEPDANTSAISVKLPTGMERRKKEASDDQTAMTSANLNANSAPEVPPRGLNRRDAAATLSRLVAILRAEGGDMYAARAPEVLYRALPRARDVLAAAGGFQKFCSMFPAELEFVAQKGGGRDKVRLSKGRGENGRKAGGNSLGQLSQGNSKTRASGCALGAGSEHEYSAEGTARAANGIDRTMDTSNVRNHTRLGNMMNSAVESIASISGDIYDQYPPWGSRQREQQPEIGEWIPSTFWSGAQTGNGGMGGNTRMLQNQTSSAARGCCALCGDGVCESKLRPCGHPACRSCIATIMYHRSSEMKAPICPICRRDVNYMEPFLHEQTQAAFYLGSGAFGAASPIGPA